MEIEGLGWLASGGETEGFGSLVLGAGWVSSMREREIIQFALFRFLVFIFYFF